MIWLIRNSARYWNSQTGWGKKTAATKFTLQEKESLSVPIDGEWVCTFDPWSYKAVPNDDNRITIQPLNFDVIVSGGRKNDEGENYFEEEELRNIQLMVAAPALLDACEKMLRFMEEEYLGEVYEWKTLGLRLVIEYARGGSICQQ